MKRISYLHLIFGLAGFAMFLVTGKLMRLSFPDKNIIPQDFRLLMRSRHIYPVGRIDAYFARGLPAAAFFRLAEISANRRLGFALCRHRFACLRFFYETYTTGQFSGISRWGLYLTLAGTIFHLFGGFQLKSKNDE